MGDFRVWLQDRIARLDGARERKVVALGAMTLLIILSVGPTVLHAVAAIDLTQIAAHRPAAASKSVTTMPVVPETTVTSHAETAQAQPEAVETAKIVSPAAPKATPILTVLFPEENAAANGPVTIAARLKDATAVGLIFEVRDASGATRALPALPSMTVGEWSVIFNGEPGDYVLSARASLDSGYVLAFKEERPFHIVPSEPAATAPSDAVIELIAPDPKDNPFSVAVPLAARIKDSAAGAVVFIVTVADGTETLVLGTEAENGGYWTAIFEGAPGDYRVRARATVGDHDVASPDLAFTLR